MTTTDQPSTTPALPEQRGHRPAGTRVHPRGRTAPDLPEVRTADAQFITLWDKKMSAARFSPNTRSMYVGAAQLAARWLTAEGCATLDQVRPVDMWRYFAWMAEEARTRTGKPYSPGYVNNQFRCLEQLFKFLAKYFQGSDPMADMDRPKVPEVAVPVVTDEQIVAMFANVTRRKDFESRRDYALLRLFIATGGRLSEITQLTTAIDTENMVLHITGGKGGKDRVVGFDPGTAEAIVDYMIVRARHPHAWRPNLWLAVRGGPLTPNGVRQIIRRRAREVGATINPHKFRHTFSHQWLRNGGQESDLMLLMGWSSPQMVRRYGKSGAQARAVEHQRDFLADIIPEPPRRRKQG